MTALILGLVLFLGIHSARIVADGPRSAFIAKRGANAWKGLYTVLSLAGFVALHLQGWKLGHVVGVVLPLGVVMTSLYLWRRNLVFMIITHFLLDLPIVLLAFGVLPPI